MHEDSFTLNVGNNLWEQLQSLPYANPDEGKSTVRPWIKPNNM